MSIMIVVGVFLYSSKSVEVSKLTEEILSVLLDWDQNTGRTLCVIWWQWGPTVDIIAS